MYNADLGRFMQADPIGYEDQMNLYAYVGNDPINLIDPTGEKGFFTNIAGFFSQFYSNESDYRSIDAPASAFSRQDEFERQNNGYADVGVAAGQFTDTYIDYLASEYASLGLGHGAVLGYRAFRSAAKAAA